MMELINGKFFENGKSVPAQFGNWEQIRLMQRYEKMVETFSNDGIVLNPDSEIHYTVAVKFKCVCGHDVYQQDDDAYSSDDYSGLTGVCACRKCRQTYEISIKKRDLIVKFARKE